MCVICAKPAGVKRPTDEQIQAMIAANPHGFGLATYENGKIILRKTMDSKEYFKWAAAVPDDIPAIYHMRIATHGSVNVNNCHPFLSDNKQWAFAHNGILTIDNEGDMTDSETFFRRLAMPFIVSGYLPKSNTFDKMIDCIIGSSKFVFLHNGELIRYGHWIEDGSLFFSNQSYIPVKYNYNYDPFHWGQTSNFTFDLPKSKGSVNKKGSDEYWGLVDTISADFCYDTDDIWELSYDELYSRYKQQYPKLKKKIFDEALKEAYSYC